MFRSTHLAPEALDIELQVHGFPLVDCWRREARHVGFRHGRARPVPECPDCGCRDAPVVGQFVHYANCMRLRRCPECDLLWVDRHLNPRVIADHFERVYKDEAYYQVARAPMLDHLAALVTAHAPAHGHVLDIGGATGHLLGKVAALRPDLILTLHDISESATAEAAERFGMATMTGPLTALRGQWDVVVASDVLYYEPSLRAAWDTLANLVRPGGVLLLRVPNKRAVILAVATLERLVQPAHHRQCQRRVRWFNPEHLYVFGRTWLQSRLVQSGFEDVTFLPSPLPGGKSALARQGWYQAACLVRSLTGLVFTPGVVVVARRT